ncbi:acyl-CoA thioesterase [Pseudorhodoplanes sinuspersici]|uniref:Thioesterase n=1 Tax=Pseudorhodoplanes sinuspersici TaxID=1235591 RepID=A0A1W7A0Z0_9HYPH|nr:thioesterase family protein [Pseudorhodoplanes sinuspersici]ARQ03250.1 thioesterase [Pseudorhodoplanes sinuspersici]RKE74423.1 (3S)-malyl-CoA thioesterase [Pseudorhodoplanes sinuspersici]
MTQRLATPRPAPHARSAYPHHRAIATRWMDNDVYGHVNNVTYYSYFDTIVNGYLIERGALDIAKSPVIGLVVETQCHYFKPVSFPDTLTGALRVAHRGTSSVRYEIGLFREDDDLASAQGHFVHVYVDRVSGRPVALPEELQRALAGLVMP